MSDTELSGTPEDLEKHVKKMTREIKLLNKKLARSEANRVQAEKMKDETDILYENVLEQIAAQKQAIEEAQERLNGAFQVISSSITYASRIQRSILPNDTLMSSVFSDHFVLWEPRDQVGGDIYWCDVWGDGVLIILGDCTGHGVPGAFMTLISSGALERAKTDIKVGDTAALVQRMHQLIQITLGQHSETGESDDGLELGACYISSELDYLDFVGARFELFIIENGEVQQVKGTKQGLGYRGISYSQEFETHKIDITDQRTFYMTTDGVIDQVGGERRRMYGKKRLKALLLELQDLPMEQQRQRILESLEKYQGDETRRDDVSMLGFKCG